MTMSIWGWLTGSDWETEVIIHNYRTGETWTSTAENDEELEEGIQALRDAGYTVTDETPPWTFWNWLKGD
jgi:hypothetical protein